MTQQHQPPQLIGLGPDSTPPPAPTWVVYVPINITGCTVAQLTAGKVSMYLKLEKLEAADKIIGFDLAGSTGVNTI